MSKISLGLDVGHHQVRAIALAPPRAADLREGFRARVVASASVDRLSLDGSAKPLPAVLAEIETLLGRRGATTAHFSDVNALVRFIPTIPLPPDKRQRLLRLELLQHADDQGDLAADAWEVAIPGDEIIHGCIIGQPAPIIASLAAIRTARMAQPAISYAPAAIANAIPDSELPTGTYTLVIDIGGTSTGVSLLGDGHLLACRQVPVGGEGFTEALMASGLDRATAERRKRGTEPAPAPVPVPSPAPESALELPTSPTTPPVAPTKPPARDAEFDSLFADDAPALELIPPSPAPSAPPAAPLEFLGFDEPGSETDASPADQLLLGTTAPLPQPGAATMAVGRAALGPELQRNAEVFYSQIAASVLWFKTQLRLDKLVIGQVWLAGGGATLPGLDTYLTRRFNAPVNLSNPFTLVRSEHPPSDSAAWTAVIGLALAGQKAGKRPVMRLDVRPESLIRSEFRRRHQIWPYVAAASLVATTAIAGTILWQASEAQNASVEKIEAWKTKRTELMGKLTSLEGEKAALSEDLRAIAGRIYAGRDLLSTVRVMKELTAQSPALWVTRLETKGVGSDPLTSDSLGGSAPATPPAKGYDSAIDRGAVLISGKVKFNAAPTDTELDQFLKTWREAIASWKPSPEAPTLFLRQRVVEWDPNHRAPGTKVRGSDEGEFPFKIEFTFRPTELSQITAIHERVEGGK